MGDDEILAATASPVSSATTLPAAAGTELRHDSIGTRHVVATVVATPAPVAALVGLIPLGILLGNGVGMPGALFLVALLVLCFAVGFVRMVPYVRNAGAFYAYVTQGIGGGLGLSVGYILIVVYIAGACALLGALGYFMNTLFVTFFNVNVPWLVFALIVAVATTALSISGVRIAARVMMAMLTCEAIAVAVLDVAILARAGISSMSLQAVNPKVVFSGAFGLAVIYAFACFPGFEGTAIYAEEVKNPLRTIPRATYWVVAIIGTFYGLSTWILLAGAGFSNAVGAVGRNPGMFVYGLGDQYIGSGFSDVLQVMNVFSLLAGTLAFQGDAGRYLFALARDGVLPRPFARTVPRLGTPALGLLVVGLLMIVAAIYYAAARQNPYLNMSTSLSGVSTIGLMGCLVFTSFAVARFFYRRRERTFTRVAMPVITGLLLTASTVLALINYPSLTGTHSTIVNSLPYIHLALLIAGLGFAYWLKRRRREAYAALGSNRGEAS